MVKNFLKALALLDMFFVHSRPLFTAVVYISKGVYLQIEPINVGLKLRPIED